jgi:lysyl-tRNA synthetase class I
MNALMVIEQPKDTRQEYYLQKNERARREAQTDPCSYAGASELAKKIKTYWAERGRKVEVELEPFGYDHRAKADKYAIRSNMRNGWPT